MRTKRKWSRRIGKVVAEYPTLHDFATWLKPRQNVFKEVYATPGCWKSAESASGEGSELAATETLRLYLPELFRRFGVQTLLDAPCGDWNWMRLVDLTGVDYVGVDIVPDLISDNQAKYARSGVRFEIADITNADLPRADLILCRDCWIHLSFIDIAAVMERFFHSGGTWLLVTNSPFVERNTNQLTGRRWRHLNLRRPPFNFPEPMEARKDNYPHQPFEIALWRISDLPRKKLESVVLVDALLGNSR